MIILTDWLVIIIWNKEIFRSNAPMTIFNPAGCQIRIYEILPNLKQLNSMRMRFWSKDVAIVLGQDAKKIIHCVKQSP